MKTIRVGVIGTGHLGRYHALNYAQIPEAELIGVADLDPARAGRVARESRSRAFQTLTELLSEVDAVSVAVPTDAHFDVVRTVFESGKHGLVEKPVTRTVPEADELIRLAGEKRRVFQVGHIERFNPALSGLDRTRIHPRFIEAHRLAPFNPRGTEVAVILDLMIHDIDVVLSLVQAPVASVDASGVAVVSDSVDIANARIRFENGAVANLTASRISQKKMRKMRLFQKDAYISVDFDGKFSEIYQLESGAAEADMVLGEIGTGDRKKRILYRKTEAPDTNALRTELEAFLAAVRGDPSGGVTGREGREALVVAQAILEKIGAG
ncbi:MAG TPA: Gfo/Idh/MocA family oxidoreductase [bacterium]|nr:Gfo/Idh/MocA family oxidoreductase [bacterium]